MKKIIMAAALLSIVTSGEVNALAAKTTHRSVAKITHVKVAKHQVTGYTTAESHIKLMKLKHREKASTTANKKGKFTVKVKRNNLTELAFKIKATKPGLKARTYTHKVKKALQVMGNCDCTTGETPASTPPASPDDGKAPEKPSDEKNPQEVPHTYVVYKTAQTEFENAQKDFDRIIGNSNKTDKQQNTRAVYLELIKGQFAEINPDGTRKNDPDPFTSFGDTLDCKVTGTDQADAEYHTAGMKIKSAKTNYAQLLKAAKRLLNAEDALKAMIATDTPKKSAQQQGQHQGV